MKKILLILSAIFLSFATFGQGLRDVQINEILVKNVDSYADGYGHKVGWIELYNSGYSSVNIAGAHIRFIQGGDTTVYRIPKNDARTNIAPQGYTIFFTNGSSTKGTFHTNFTLNETDPERLAMLEPLLDRLEILDQSGKTVVDSIEYDLNTQIEDVSFGRIHNHDTGELEIKNLTHVTPMQTNEILEATPKSELFRAQDPVGLAMAITAMSVVFSALMILFLVFKTIGIVMQRQGVKKEKAVKADAPANIAAGIDANSDIQGETIAAIAIALKLYEEDLHDIESNVITINKVAKSYSPWSSKIYSMRQIPNKKTW